MTGITLTEMIDVMAARLEKLDPDSPEHSQMLAEMDALAERLARDAQQEVIDEATESLFDNMPV
jgi:hypothetical protein